MLFPPPPHSSALHRHSAVTNIMFFPIISLLLVILFVLLLHLYARWYLYQASQRTTQTTVTLPLVLGSRLHHRFSTSSSARSTGLPSSIIASLPFFVHKPSPSLDSSNFVSECAICLSVFQEEEIGRKLPGCGHAFHVDCIDMWLHSHSTCPICRAAILYNYYNRKFDNVNCMVNDIEIMDHLVDHDREIRLEIDQNVVRAHQVEESHESTTNDVLEIDCGIGRSSSSGSLIRAATPETLDTKENEDSHVI